jgi:hypothetical protein
MERIKSAWQAAQPRLERAANISKLSLLHILKFLSTIAKYVSKVSKFTWPYLRDYAPPTIRQIFIIIFNMLRITLLPATALLIAILTQTKVGGVMLIGMAAWLAAKMNIDDVIKEACSGDWWDTFKCTIAVIFG